MTKTHTHNKDKKETSGALKRVEVFGWSSIDLPVAILKRP